jgi:hypothetical protein
MHKIFELTKVCFECKYLDHSNSLDEEMCEFHDIDDTERFQYLVQSSDFGPQLGGLLSKRIEVASETNHDNWLRLCSPS